MASDLPSITSIANNAISRVGSTERVTSLDAQSPTAQRLRDFWPQLRRAMLVRHPFNFALWRRDLNQAGGSELPALDQGVRAYRLPQDCVRWLPAAHGDQDWFAGESEGGFLLVRHRDAGALRIRYIRDVSDVTLWSAGFVEAFTQALSSLLAQPVTQSAAMAQWLDDTAERAVRLAKRIDGLETGARRRGNVVRTSEWLSARNGWNRGAHR